MIVELEEKVEQLEKDAFRMKQEKSSSNNKGGYGAGVAVNKDENDKIIRDLSKSNALLRRKLDDALEKIGK